MIKKETVFSKDLTNKKIIVEKAFDAPLEQVWEAWTNSEILDKWWAPKPYHTENKLMDFREGGLWLYAMVGPEGDRSTVVIEITFEKSANLEMITGMGFQEGFTAGLSNLDEYLSTH